MKIILVLLIIAGIIFIAFGIATFYETDEEESSGMDWIGTSGNPVFNYSNEIEGFCYLLTGTLFIVSGLYLIVRLKELS